MGEARLGLDLAAWGAAWRARKDNPLPGLWQLAQARQAQRRHWLAQWPALLLGLALSAALTYSLLLLLRQFLALHHSALANQAYALALLRTGTLLLLHGALVLGAVWLLARLYGCAERAWSLLRQPLRLAETGEDDALRASVLSDEEFVLGLLLYTWRALLPPLLLSLVAGAAVYCAWPADPAVGDAPSQGAVWAVTAWGALARVLAQLVAGSLGAALLVLLCAWLGSLPGSRRWPPGLGAALVVAGQVLSLAGLALCGAWLTAGTVSYNCWLYTLATLTWVPSAGLLLLWSRGRGARARAGALPLLGVVWALALLWAWGVLGGGFKLDLSLPGVWLSTCQIIGCGLLPAISASAVLERGAAMDQWPLLVGLNTVAALLQSLLIWPLALLALGAVHAWRRGAP